MKRLKKSVLIPSMLLVYLAVMAYMGRGMIKTNLGEYILILLVTLGCIMLLTITMRKQEQIRERKARELQEQQKEQEKEQE